jgi:hypothetical protein
MPTRYTGLLGFHGMRTVVFSTFLAFMATANAGEPGSCGGTLLFRVPSNPPLQFHLSTKTVPDYVVVLTRAPGPAWRVGVFEPTDTQFRINLLPSGLPGYRNPGNEHGPLSLSPMFFKEHPNPWILSVSNSGARLCISFSDTQLLPRPGKAFPTSDADLRFVGGELLVSWLAAGT